MGERRHGNIIFLHLSLSLSFSFAPVHQTAPNYPYADQTQRYRLESLSLAREIMASRKFSAAAVASSSAREEKVLLPPARTSQIATGDREYVQRRNFFRQ